jgi:hypothetical protein
VLESSIAIDELKLKQPALTRYASMASKLGRLLEAIGVGGCLFLASNPGGPNVYCTVILDPCGSI